VVVDDALDEEEVVEDDASAEARGYVDPGPSLASYTTYCICDQEYPHGMLVLQERRLEAREASA
jgi:hypothetical protein